METKNESEKLFEQYLDENEFKGKWTYEPSIPGKNKKPDYLLDYNTNKYFFEVKELREKSSDPNGAAYIDPYSSLRSEINEARKQFKKFKDYCCSLVVFNLSDRPVKLKPLFVLGAMLGNLGLRMDYNSEKGQAVPETEENFFLDGGKMFNYKRKQPQNTTISAIITLEKFRDSTELDKAIIEEMKKQGKKLTLEEKVGINKLVCKKYHSRTVTRVVVVKNPYARVMFPDNLFNGPFDERWRWSQENGEVKRVFTGNKLKELEKLKDKS